MDSIITHLILYIQYLHKIIYDLILFISTLFFHSQLYTILTPRVIIIKNIFQYIITYFSILLLISYFPPK